MKCQNLLRKTLFLKIYLERFHSHLRRDARGSGSHNSPVLLRPVSPLGATQAAVFPPQRQVYFYPWFVCMRMRGLVPEVLVRFWFWSFSASRVCVYQTSSSAFRATGGDMNQTLLIDRDQVFPNTQQTHAHTRNINEE